ncbi:DNA-directed RNA polymerases I, II, and III subunit RPABC5 [Tritrichomonas foetus]|uniref:DNA-directed RNA polymerases I, II, and III subunit RPABC5 n=1 Tax=Tritrichomonas foetus TaxID=1144522 RepID=A0A1J4KIC0_9EUKA|nr:DNA-directed RNA polymerases I, II, and III subunit RPABC5 [Tritrichomonas foetus]|eukprot:OHT11121.1 DNA-directed RNA polymerases I, II, and III subunit RPABC5 [Tritrichomonas foetus]
MIIPIRCFTCGNILGNKWEVFNELIENGYDTKAALELLGLNRYCCRRMMLAHVDLVDRMLRYTRTDAAVEISSEQYSDENGSESS